VTASPTEEAEYHEHRHAAMGHLSASHGNASACRLVRPWRRIRGGGSKKPMGASAPGMLSMVKEAFLTGTAAGGGEEVFFAAKASREVNAPFVTAGGGTKATVGPTRREARTSFIIVILEV
jgi:hypothetical protein